MSVEQYQTGSKAAEPEDGGETGEDWVRSIADPEDDEPPVTAAESSWNRAVPAPPATPTPARVVLRPRGRLGRDSTWTRAAYADASDGIRTPIPVAIEDPPRDMHHSATIELDVGDLEIEPARARRRREPTLEVVPLPPPIPQDPFRPTGIVRPWSQRLTPRPSRRQRITTCVLGAVAIAGISVLLSRSPTPSTPSSSATPAHVEAAAAPPPSPPAPASPAPLPAAATARAETKPAAAKLTRPPASKAVAKPTAPARQATAKAPAKPARPAAKPTPAKSAAKQNSAARPTTAATKGAAAAKPSSSAAKPKPAKPAAVEANRPQG